MSDSRVVQLERDANNILAKPSDRDELLKLAKIANRVKFDAMLQAGELSKERPADDCWITPLKVSEEFGPSLWRVQEEIRKGRLKSYPEGARRNVKVRRGDARALFGGES